MKRYETDFDAAMAFLQVSRSTLNRWVHDGKLPARKVGGQWRFSEDDLKKLRDGSGEPAPLVHAREDLRRFLESSRANRKGPKTMNPSIESKSGDLAEALVWEAHDRKASELHLQPRKDGVHIAVGKNARLETIRVIPQELARELEQAWDEIGLPFGDSGIRRLFLSRDGAQAVNEVSVLLQAIDTLQGRRLTLRFMGGGRIADLEAVAPKAEDRAVFERWLHRPNGIILFSGLPGSGKTTTLLSCLQHLAKDAGLAVFSLEYPAYVRVDGVDQVEVASEEAPVVKAALERIMRMYPNAIGICLETAETAAAALNMATSGHLVLMHIEAEGHEAAMKRLEQLAGKPVAPSVIGVISQRLKRGEAGGKVAEYQFWEEKGRG
ncbi:MAG: type II secretion system protein [Planctomycetota bacterium]|nr:MAG: type II secretion system protein [Planctomycetota bacterium]